mgnify:FL=1
MKKRVLFPMLVLFFVAGSSLLLLGQASSSDVPRQSGRSGDTGRMPESPTGVLREAGLPQRVYPGYPVIRALARAYPGRVSRISVRDRQWVLQMDGVWYYWADGRLLSEEHLDDLEAFAPLRFYDHYAFGPLQKREVPPEFEARLRERDSVGGNDERSRFNAFNDALYRISSRLEAERIVEWTRFLDRRVRVHPLLIEPLRRVEERILAAAPGDPETQRFIDELFQIHGYNWRNIVGTARRSYHSYGIAVDLLPLRWYGGWAYWQWAYDGGVEEWWDLDLDDRWLVPQPIVDAFEAEGFIWGGKWLFFDNMHFEYRPESIILAQGE